MRTNEEATEQTLSIERLEILHGTLESAWKGSRHCLPELTGTIGAVVALAWDALQEAKRDAGIREESTRVEGAV